MIRTMWIFSTFTSSINDVTKTSNFFKFQFETQPNLIFQQKLCRNKFCGPGKGHLMYQIKMQTKSKPCQSEVFGAFLQIQASIDFTLRRSTWKPHLRFSTKILCDLRAFDNFPDSTITSIVRAVEEFLMKSLWIPLIAFRSSQKKKLELTIQLMMVLKFLVEAIQDWRIPFTSIGSVLSLILIFKACRSIKLSINSLKYLLTSVICTFPFKQ